MYLILLRSVQGAYRFARQCFSVDLMLLATSKSFYFSSGFDIDKELCVNGGVP